MNPQDWENLRHFSKQYIRELKEMIPDITVAEQRMAALTRLHLNTKQMASVPGISSDSVYKIRQRLRKRLPPDDEVTTEAY